MGGSVENEKKQTSRSLLLVVVIAGLISIRRTSLELLFSCRETYLVSLLLVLVTLLVGSSLGLVGTTLLIVESLPALTKNLAHLTCRGGMVLVKGGSGTVYSRCCLPNEIPGFSSRTFSRCSFAKNM